MARGSKSRTVVWALMALLILGLGGFGVTNFSGAMRSIGSVGDQEIATSEYARAVQDEIRAFEAQTGQQIPFSTARAMQLDQVALARLIARTALDDEAARAGISVGDANLRDQLLQIEGFAGLDGKFDREAYRFYLDRSGQTENQFEDGIRRELSRGLLQAAVVAGVPAAPTYADTLVAYIGEQRDFTWARLSEADLAEPLPEPSEEELAAFHAANEALFTRPETRVITYAWLSPDMILDTVDVDETALKEAYDARSDEFNQPERRLVERLAFADDAAAEAAKLSLEKGETSFEALVESRGLTLSDVDLGDVLESALGEAGAAVFNAEAGAVVGPFASDLGPALFRINGSLPARTMSFEEARDTLRDELAADRARRVIDRQMDDLDDLLAEGSTIEELAQDSEMELFTIDWTPDTAEGASGYAGFQQRAAQITTEDFPELIRLEDGGLLAMRLDEIQPPRVEPLDDVRDAVIAAWEDAEITKRLREQAEALAAQITPESDMAALGLTVTAEKAITREGFIPGTGAAFLPAVFEMAPGETRVIDLPAAVLLVRLDAVAPPDAGDDDIARARAALQAQAASGQAQDLFQYFINDVQGRAGLQIDQNAINAVNAQFQ